MFTKNDFKFMARAMELGRRGRLTSSPNPSVGCVIVKNDKIVGEGWHSRAGEPHAEAHALEAAGPLAHGATVYVTLEPCSHHGRTPPCSDALIQAKVARVVYALEDPSPKVAGAGAAALIASGIQVEKGLMREQGLQLHRGFVQRFVGGRPWFVSKTAASLDGKTSLANGVSQWITGIEARRAVHQLRAQSCGVMTGVDTVLADDPSLNVRHVESSRQPRAIVIDTNLRFPLDAKLLSVNAQSLLIFHSCEDVGKVDDLERAGATLVFIPKAESRVDLKLVAGHLAKLEFNEVLVEAGATLNGALMQTALLDELFVFLAPSLLGGTGRNMFALPQFESLDARVKLEWQSVRQVGDDLLVTARPRYP